MADLPDSSEAHALRGAADSAFVSIGFGDDWTDDGSTRHVADPAAVQVLLARRGSTWRRREAATLDNELRQYEAARVLGVDQIHMTFRVALRTSKPAGSFRRRRFGTIPEFLLRYSGPKLAVASIYAAAPAPTPFDLERLRLFGYRDVAHVAQRIAEWNSVNTGEQLPVPPIER